LHGLVCICLHMHVRVSVYLCTYATCMFVCLCICAHMRVRVSVYLCTYAHACSCACVFVHICVFMCLCICAHMHVRVSVYLCTYACLCVCICAHMRQVISCFKAQKMRIQHPDLKIYNTTTSKRSCLKHTRQHQAQASSTINLLTFTHTPST